MSSDGDARKKSTAGHAERAATQPRPYAACSLAAELSSRGSRAVAHDVTGPGWPRGRLAVVTGGGSGIGRELVYQLAAAGCSVATCDLDPVSLAETEAHAVATRTHDAVITAHRCDVTDEPSVARFRDELCARHSTDHVDLLFNNAGMLGAGSFLVDDRAEWERVFDVCWGGVYTCCRVFIPLLIASDRAYLINMSSVMGFWASRGGEAPATAYGAAKFAVKGLTEGLIDDFRINAPHVTAAVVMPGSVATNISANSGRLLAGARSGDSARGKPHDVRATLATYGVPLIGSLGEEALSAVLAEVVRLDNEMAPTTAAQAAATILRDLDAGRWRILVGDDARRLDAAVRAHPDDAYSPGGPALQSAWLPAVLTIGGYLAIARDPGISATIALRQGPDTIAVSVAEGRVSALSGLQAPPPDVIVEGEPAAMLALLAGGESSGTVRGPAPLLVIDGDAGRFEQVLAAIRRACGAG